MNDSMTQLAQLIGLIHLAACSFFFGSLMSMAAIHHEWYKSVKKEVVFVITMIVFTGILTFWWIYDILVVVYWIGALLPLWWHIRDSRIEREEDEEESESE